MAKDNKKEDSQDYKSFKVKGILGGKSQVAPLGAFILLFFSLAAIITEYTQYLGLTEGWRWLWIGAAVGLILLIGGLFSSDTRR